MKLRLHNPAWIIGLMSVGLLLGLGLKLAAHGPDRAAFGAIGNVESRSPTAAAAARSASTDHWLRRADRAGSALIVASLAGGVALMLATRKSFFTRFVGPATPGTLGAIRMLIAAVLLANAFWEDLPSTAWLPRELARPMGVIDWLRAIPGFDSMLASHAALAVLKSVVCACLFFAMIGWRTRWFVPLGALGWFLLGGIVRQYAWFTHQGIVPAYMLTLLSFTPCGDGFSLDRLIKLWNGKPVPPADEPQPIYGWSRYICWTIFALCYVAAGLSKLRNGGLDWWNADNMRAIILGDALNPMYFESHLGLHLRHAPDWVFAMLGMASLFGELSAIGVLFSRLFRHFYALFIVSMHAGIWLLQNVLFFDMMFTQFILVDFRTFRKVLGRQLNARHGTLRVLYDGWCPLCRRTRRIVEALDLLSRTRWVDFRPLADARQIESEFGARVDPSDAEREMFVLYRGKAAGGYFGYRLLARVIPALWPTLPALYLPGVSWLGQKAYAYIARNRLGLLQCAPAGGGEGACAIEPPAGQNEAVAGAESSRRRGNGFPIAMFTLVIVVLMTVWALGLEYYPLTSVQMYSRNKRDGVVTYARAIAYYESGATGRAYFDQAIGALADARYRRIIDMCFSPRDQEKAWRTLRACAAILNRNAPPGQRIVAFGIERRRWDFRHEPDDPDFGQTIQSLVIPAAGRVGPALGSAVSEPSHLDEQAE